MTPSRPLRTAPLARWNGATPVEALEPDFAPLEWIIARARCVDRSKALPPRPEEPIFGWAAAADAVGVSERLLRQVLGLLPDVFAYEVRCFPGMTTLRECRHAELAILSGRHREARARLSNPDRRGDIY